MAVPKIRNNHDPETRNIINRVIEVLNKVGIDMQTLVAEGQLTPEQYADLIYVVEGLVKKGHIVTDDLDINGFKIDERYVSAEFLKQVTGDAPVHSIPADNSISYNKLASDLSGLIDSKVPKEVQKNIDTLSLNALKKESSMTNYVEFSGDTIPAGVESDLGLELIPTANSTLSLKVESGAQELFIGAPNESISFPNGASNSVFTDGGSWKINKLVSDKYTINNNTKFNHSTFENVMMLSIPRSELNGITNSMSEGIMIVDGMEELEGVDFDNNESFGKFTTSLSSSYVGFFFDLNYGGFEELWLARDEAIKDLIGTTFYYQLEENEVEPLPYFGNISAVPNAKINLKPVLWGFSNASNEIFIGADGHSATSVTKLIRFEVDKGNFKEIDVTSDAQIQSDGKTLRINNFDSNKIYFYECTTDAPFSDFDIKQKVKINQSGSSGSGVWATPSDYNGNVHEALASGKQLLIPQGETYTINKPLEPGINSLLMINGTLRMADSVIQNVQSDISAGSDIIVVEDGSKFEIGQWIGVTDDNQPLQGGGAGLVPRTRLEGFVGKISSISGNTLTIDGGVGIRRSISPSHNAKVGTLNSAILIESKSNVTVCGNGLVDGNSENQISMNPVSTASWFEEVRAGCGLSSFGSENVSFRDLRVENFALHNVVLAGLEDNPTKHSKVSNVKSKYAYDKNILVFITEDCSIINNEADESQVEDGISAHWYNKNLEIYGNKTRNNPRFGIYLRDETHNAKMSENTSEDNYINYQLDVNNTTGSNNTSYGGKHDTYSNLIRGKNNTLYNFNAFNIGDLSGMFLTGVNNRIKGGTFKDNSRSFGAITVGVSGNDTPINCEISSVIFEDNEKAIRLVDGDGTRVLDNYFENNMSDLDNRHNATNTVIDRNANMREITE